MTTVLQKEDLRLGELAVKNPVTAVNAHGEMEQMRVSLISLAGKAWTNHRNDIMSPVTAIEWQPVKIGKIHEDFQRCGYTISIPQPDNQYKSVTISLSKDTEWTTHFDDELKSWPQNTTVAVKIYNDDFTHSDLRPATMEDLQECEKFLKTL